MNNEAMENEVKACLAHINEIQRKVFDHTITKMDREAFRKCSHRLAELGYTTRKRKVRNEFGTLTGVVWSAIPHAEKKPRNTECEFVYTDVRPKNRKCLKGDCTTRAIYWAMEGRMSYDEIESRQYVLAAQRHTRRNTRGTWEIVLTEHNFAKLILERSVKRSVLASMLCDFLTRPAVTVSSGHAAAIDREGVRDTWDSRGGRCTVVYVHSDDAEMVRSTLCQMGVYARIGTVLLPRA